MRAGSPPSAAVSAEASDAGGRDLGVRPCPRVGQVGQLHLWSRRRPDPQHRQRARAGRVEPHAGSDLDDDEAQPRAQRPATAEAGVNSQGSAGSSNSTSAR